MERTFIDPELGILILFNLTTSTQSVVLRYILLIYFVNRHSCDVFYSVNRHPCDVFIRTYFLYHSFKFPNHSAFSKKFILFSAGYWWEKLEAGNCHLIRLCMIPAIYESEVTVPPPRVLMHIINFRMLGF